MKQFRIQTAGSCARLHSFWALSGWITASPHHNYSFFEIFTLHRRFWIRHRVVPRSDSRQPRLWATLAERRFFDLCIAGAFRFPLGDRAWRFAIPRRAVLGRGAALAIAIVPLLEYRGNMIPALWLA